MEVKLISITPNAEETIMYCARVSNPANQDSTNTKLLDYCIKKQHWSIFEMGNMVMEITCSRGISAQILRHRSFSFQEFSLRYAEATEFETYPARRQDSKNRQNSIDDMSLEDRTWFIEQQLRIQEDCMRTYKEALNRQIAKEQARFLLPLATQTRIYMSGSIRSWLTYLDLRCGVETQLEHREIADAIKEIFVKELPNIAKAKGWLAE
jgi:thymidylate synthase (FAD)